MNDLVTDDASDSRRTLLSDASRDAARLWAQGWFDDLRQQGRLVTGGWPGTMSEARGRTRAHIDALLNRQLLPAVTQGELAEGTRATYQSAKALWLRSQVRGEGVA